MGLIFNHGILKNRRRDLRNRMTDSEKRLWFHLKSKQIYGYKFRRQFSFGRYVVDFYCPDLRLVIELDGDSHYGNGAQSADLIRQQYIESLGIVFLRFSNLEISQSLEDVVQRIKSFIKNNSRTPPLTPPC